MAYRAAGTTTIELYQKMKELGLLKSPKVEQILNVIDRKVFIPYDCSNVLKDAPEFIGHNATISAPHMHIFALEQLEENLCENSTVLDIGSGSGYLTLCFALMIGKGAKVIGVEHIPELVKKSKENIRRAGYGHLLDDKTIEIIEGDGRLGYSNSQPYDAIHVGAAAETIPKPLLDQLKNDGRMILPVDNQLGYQDYVRIQKSNSGELIIQKLMPVSYVPLTDIDKQLNKYTI